ncbi:ARF guanine-nucleotide exchange factor GNL2-like [Pyrus ussuriensis x Pyrus communis]|uniref:ARF guanine-nucleotide exchange factor GNL2-like n=1 Tax=Pyrus ussuriensis x Pyrus communis TaxID=2448454 RepID=A0A5N5FBA0_9ROSA|nr:ARF guanine-nucleotide exchange factor GNL2-like [Pyrus ussuriensis x Pyrus communis]
MICSTVLNMYHFLRRFIRLQLEAFFTFVLFRVSAPGVSIQLQEVALEGIINFCRQLTFVVEVYVNYDCDPLCHNVFEEIGKLLCKLSFPVASPLTTLQIQAFEGLVIMIHNIADSIDRENDTSPSGPYPIEIREYTPFWEDKAKDDSEAWVQFVRLRKAQKRKILIAGHHFNCDEKKGMEYLKLSNLVSDPPDPKTLAYFFRYTPGLDKTMIGDYLGDPDEFHIKVLKDFTGAFGFSGMNLDSALRTYLETFRLPGESQKIQRILEAFSESFFEQQSADVFVNKDTVFILCYSLIMLNTDQHNPQVKKKMTEEEFIRNNRAINGGKDLPREYLSELFQSISNNAITLFGQSGMTVLMNPSRWIELMNRSKTVQPFILCDFDRRLGRDMFACIAGPSVATISAFFEQAEEEELLHECIEGLFSVARIAQYGLEDTLDELIATFSRFTTLLNPYASAEETLFAFSKDLKPRMATLAVFTIANNFGESIRGGWRNIMDCLLKLKRLKLLPQNSPEDAASLGMSEFEQNLKVIKQCRIGDIFSTSSNFPKDSLLNLGHSLIYAAAGKGQKFSTPVEEEETVGFCWDLIVAISLANVHRFQAFWLSFHDYLLAVAQFPMFSPIPFSEKAIVGLFKVCLKLLGTDLTESLRSSFSVETLMMMMSDGTHVLQTNYAYCINCALGFIALRNSPSEKNLKILDLLADSVNLLIQWYRNQYSDPGNNYSIASNTNQLYQLFEPRYLRDGG